MPAAHKTQSVHGIAHKQVRTLSVRVKDKHAALLNRWAYDVNQVWNAANEESSELSWVPVPGVGWMNFGTSEFDLQKELRVIRKARNLKISSYVLYEVISVHARARRKHKKNKLKWRRSSGTKRSLGWVPFKARAAKCVTGGILFNGILFKVWDSYNLSQYRFKSGSFSEDSRGRWYFNVAVEHQVTQTEKTSAVGIDLGVKTYATCSDGTRLEAIQPYRELEKKLRIAQRAGNKRRVKAIHAKIKNRRKDALHKFSRQLVNNYGAIVIGDISSAKLAKTKMAKSVLDAGWYMLKTQLRYKAIGHGVWFKEVNEAYSTQTCSHCGGLPDSSPKGRAGLEVRSWVCSDCGAKLDRDINAAINILNFGLGCQSPVDGSLRRQP